MVEKCLLVALTLMLILTTSLPQEIPLYISAVPGLPEQRQVDRHKPKVAVKYFDINGISAEELRKQLDTLGPVDELGRHRDAHTLWRISWDWPMRDGKPDFKGTKAVADITLSLPRWQPAANVDQKLRARWKKFHQTLRKHEAGHIKIVEDNYARISTAIYRAAKANPALTYLEANKIGESVLAEIRAMDRKYDRDTQHGKMQGVNLQ